jgi:hypothetical protein
MSKLQFFINQYVSIRSSKHVLGVYTPVEPCYLELYVVSSKRQGNNYVSIFKMSLWDNFDSNELKTDMHFFQCFKI